MMVMMATLTMMMMIPIQFHVVECGLPNDVVCAAQRDSLRFCVHVPDDDHCDDGDDDDSWLCCVSIMKDTVTFVTTENAENAESPENDRLVGSTRDHLDPVGVLSRKEPGRLEL